MAADRDRRPDRRGDEVRPGHGPPQLAAPSTAPSNTHRFTTHALTPPPSFSPRIAHAKTPRFLPPISRWFPFILLATRALFAARRGAADTTSIAEGQRPFPSDAAMTLSHPPPLDRFSPNFRPHGQLSPITFAAGGHTYSKGRAVGNGSILVAACRDRSPIAMHERREA